jgi:hypothetical protein
MPDSGETIERKTDIVFALRRPTVSGEGQVFKQAVRCSSVVEHV